MILFAREVAVSGPLAIGGWWLVGVGMSRMEIVNDGVRKIRKVKMRTYTSPLVSPPCSLGSCVVTW